MSILCAYACIHLILFVHTFYTKKLNYAKKCYIFLDMILVENDTWWAFFFIFFQNIIQLIFIHFESIQVWIYKLHEQWRPKFRR